MSECKINKYSQDDIQKLIMKGIEKESDVLLILHNKSGNEWHWFTKYKFLEEDTRRLDKNHQYTVKLTIDLGMMDEEY